jgi:hypothetical protein
MDFVFFCISGLFEEFIDFFLQLDHLLFATDGQRPKNNFSLGAGKINGSP